jgi:uncharacterized membrane protein
MENKQSRWKSKVLWAAIAAQVIAILAFTGVLKLIGVSEDWVNTVIGGVLQLLVLLGVINNPTDSENY